MSQFSKPHTCLQKIKQMIIVDGFRLIWYGIWISGMLGLFLGEFFHFYSMSGIVALGIAKGCAYCINYNLGFMLCFITKSLVTIFRKIGLAHIIPLNFNVQFHTAMGISTIIFGTIHALMHLIFDFNILSNADSPADLNKLMQDLDRPHRFTEVLPYSYWIKTLPSITGIFIWSMMTIMVVLAHPKLRHKNYERFWYSHFLWFPVLLLLSIHGSKEYFDSTKTPWWIIFPFAVLVFEKFILIYMYIIERHKIIDLDYLSSEVIQLKITKKSNQVFNAGQYALINIPEISKMQWHPFSVSSAPYDDFISFHIAPAGNWTSKLKEIAIKIKKNPETVLPRIRMMGPYGAPSQHHKEYKNVMIFATGVGATPFASILRDLLENALNDKNDQTKIKTIDFFWVNRKPSSHLWMNQLFMDIQSKDPDRKILNINMFFTSPQAKYDIRSFFLWTGIEILAKKGTRIPGLENFEMMHWGKPDWNSIFRKKSSEIQKGTVGVFFCGNKHLASEIRSSCIFNSGKVKFKFHQEVF